MADETGKQAASTQRKVGYKVFDSEEACRDYFRGILSGYRKHQDLNEYEYHNVMALVESYHPNAENKLQGGVRAIQIREKHVDGRPSKCFHLIKENGEVDDVSYVKCVDNMFSGK